MVEIEFARTYRAPRQLVWDAWTDPDQIAQWWGPRGVTTPRESIEIDLRPGGRIRFDMVDDATGARYPNSGTVLEVDPPSRLVYSDDGFPDGTARARPRSRSPRSTRARRRCACTSSRTSTSPSGPVPSRAGAASSTGSRSSSPAA